MLRKTLLKPSLASQVELNPVKDADIIKLYQKHLKQDNDKQRRILEIQRRAVRNNGYTIHPGSHETLARESNRLYFPPIITNNGTNRFQKQHKDSKEDKTSSNGNPAHFRLPQISKRSVGARRRNDREPVFDPRFRGLLSSLIAIPEHFGQIQRYAPSKRRMHPFKDDLMANTYPN